MVVQPEPPILPPGLLDRLRSALATARSGSSTADEEPPAIAPERSGAPAVILVTVFGLSNAALEQVFEVVSREGRDIPVTPVFLTDSLDFEPFRARRLRFEYLPDGGRRQRFAPDLDWRAYERRRYRLLVDKWRPRSLVSFGHPPSPECAAAVESPR